MIGTWVNEQKCVCFFLSSKIIILYRASPPGKDQEHRSQYLRTKMKYLDYCQQLLTGLRAFPSLCHLSTPSLVSICSGKAPGEPPRSPFHPFPSGKKEPRHNLPVVTDGRYQEANGFVPSRLESFHSRHTVWPHGETLRTAPWAESATTSLFTPPAGGRRWAGGNWCPGDSRVSAEPWAPS